jgi:hypothetical protein
MIQLTVPWEEFEVKLESYIETIQSFDPIPISEKDLNKRISNYGELRKEIRDFLNESLANDHFYSLGFYTGGGQKYMIQSVSSSPHKMLVELQSEINIDIENLKTIRNMLSVCDCIIRPDDIDLTVRQNYTTEEVLDLLLNKLYDLYGDKMYQVKPILEGNGIVSKRSREEFELVQILNQNGYVDTTGITTYADARLTLSGKMFVEDARKVRTIDYSSVSNDKDQIIEKLDEILGEVQKNNLGNEILFEEMEELKFAYDKLSKKNWGQLFKGKLVDLLVKQVINEELAKRIFEEIANMPLYLK